MHVIQVNLLILMGLLAFASCFGLIYNLMEIGSPFSSPDYILRWRALAWVVTGFASGNLAWYVGISLW